MNVLMTLILIFNLEHADHGDDDDNMMLMNGASEEGPGAWAADKETPGALAADGSNHPL